MRKSAQATKPKRVANFVVLFILKWRRIIIVGGLFRETCLFKPPVGVKTVVTKR